MKNFVLLFVFVLAFASCTTVKQPLYNWDRYTATSYNYYKRQTPEATAALMKTYENMIKKAGGTRKTVAPGVHAEYGYFLIQNGKKEEGIAMLKKEKEFYPESRVFMDRLIKQFSE